MVAGANGGVSRKLTPPTTTTEEYLEEILGELKTIRRTLSRHTPKTTTSAEGKVVSKEKRRKE